jgi:hypothetical protein
MNLHYEVKICQKIYNRLTMTVYVKSVVWFNVNKTLCTIEYFTGQNRYSELYILYSLHLGGVN